MVVDKEKGCVSNSSIVPRCIQISPQPMWQHDFAPFAAPVPSPLAKLKLSVRELSKQSFSDLMSEVHGI
jgi:hypothetical protein